MRAVVRKHLCTRTVVKFLRLLDILWPWMCRWPVERQVEWRRGLSVQDYTHPIPPVPSSNQIRTPVHKVAAPLRQAVVCLALRQLVVVVRELQVHAARV